VILWLLGLALATEPLTLDTVLIAVDQRVPELAAAEAKAEAADAKVLSARGAFDPKLKGKASTYLDGYDRQLFDAGLVGETVLGPELHAGWRLGRGDFPSYDGRKTAAGGEAYVRAEVPLLDGLVWSDARATLQQRAAWADSARAMAADKRRLALFGATHAWAKWAAAGAKLAIQEAFVRQTEERQQALDREVAEGSRAPLDQLDNRRALAERRAELATARQEYLEAAQKLSLYYRDDAGLPVVPDRSQLPELPLEVSRVEDERDPRSVADERPDVRAAVAEQRAAEVAVSRARNAVLPELGAFAEGVRPADPEVPSELIAGVSLELATLLRKGRGDRRAAAAEQLRATELARAQRDAATAQLVAARSAVVQAAERVQQARDAAELAREVLRLERRRFALGGGDIFTLLGREVKRLKSDKDLIDAQSEWIIARAWYDANAMLE
jgi:outer membrane protein TolC